MCYLVGSIAPEPHLFSTSSRPPSFRVADTKNVREKKQRGTELEKREREEERAKERKRWVTKETERERVSK